MLSEISPKQLKEWMEFYSLEPWGFDVLAEMAATMPTVFANFNRRKGGKAYKSEDFKIVPSGRVKKEALTSDEIFEMFKRAARRSDDGG